MAAGLPNSLLKQGAWMRWLLANLFSLFALSLTFGAGFIVGILSHLGDPVAYVHIANHASQPIKTMRFIHRNGEEKYSGIAIGATGVAIVPAPGETSFSTVIELTDGRQLVDKPRYAEGSYTFDVTVNDDGIATECHPFSIF